MAAERWLREGEESARYEAYHEAGREDFETPAALAALAVYLSGPSLGPQGAKVEPPSPKVGRSCATNVLMVVATSSSLGEDGFLHVNTIGLDLAAGGDGRQGARQALTAAEHASGRRT